MTVEKAVKTISAAGGPDDLGINKAIEFLVMQHFAHLERIDYALNELLIIELHKRT